MGKRRDRKQRRARGRNVEKELEPPRERDIKIISFLAETLKFDHFL